MEANLPKTPGVYWWRAKDGDEWRAIILTHVDIDAIQEDIPEFGEAYINGMTISGGQWAKAHNPDEGIEAWAVFDRDGCMIPETIRTCAAYSTASHENRCGEGSWIRDKASGYTCRKVRVCEVVKQ